MAVLIEIHPHLGKIVEVAAKPKTGTAPFECLGLRSRHGIIVICPHLTTSAVRSESMNRNDAGDDHLPSLYRFVLFHAGDRGKRCNFIRASPPRWSNDLIEAIGICSLVGVWNDTAASTVVALVGDSPVDGVRMK